MSIREGDPLGKMGKVNFEGVEKEISLSLLPEARIGEYVMVHVGFGISIVDEEEAQGTLDILRRMDELSEHVQS